MSKGRYYQDSYVEFGLRSCSTKTEFNSNNVCLLCSKVFSNGCTRLLDLGVGMCIECITGLISRGYDRYVTPQTQVKGYADRKRLRTTVLEA